MVLIRSQIVFSKQGRIAFYIYYLQYGFLEENDDYRNFGVVASCYVHTSIKFDSTSACPEISHTLRRNCTKEILLKSYCSKPTPAYRPARSVRC